MQKINIRLQVAGLFVLSLLVLMINLGHPMIYILDEAKNAGCAREMLVSGNYVVPYFNGQLRTDKPPLHYFFMVLSYKVFGVSAFSARFFSAVFGALTILISFLFSRRLLGEKTGWLTALVLLTSLHFNMQMRLAVPDPYLIFFMTASFMCFYLFVTGREKRWLWAMYLSFGLGFLTKGPVALGLPGLIMLIYLLSARKFSWKLLASFNIPAGILIVLAVSLPWYWLNYVQSHGLWTRGFFLDHNLERYSSAKEGHGGFFLLPFLMVILGLFPMGSFVIQALLNGFKKRSQDIMLYCFCVVTGIIVFFSFSQTKLPNYTAPAYPFSAILIASFLNNIIGGKVAKKSIAYSLVFYSVLAVGIPAGVYFGFQADAEMAGYRSLWLCFIALPLGMFFCWYFYRRNQFGRMIGSMAVSFIITNAFFFGFAYPKVYSQNPVRVTLDQLKGKELVYYKLMNPAYIFNLQRVVPKLNDTSELKQYMVRHPKAILISRKEFLPEILSAGDFVKTFEQRNTLEKTVTVILEPVRSGSSSSPHPHKDEKRNQ